ncbi:cell division protein PerM, partial [Allosalinactinospora lopnorensis]|uniref:cell division protein PerM n=1 Tax=Allosalinactinospora lopnorensis TaxID=1352348 RepID=UPI001F1B6EAB
MAAASAAGIGLAVLVTFTLIGWVAAPHDTLGEDIADVFRAAMQAWLVGHLVGFGIPGGHVSMLPLGLVVLPGLLLFRSGRWLTRDCGLSRPSQLFRAALALAGPYAAISGTLALVGQNDTIRPSVVQALIAGFLLAFAAGGWGVLHQVLKEQGISKRRLLDLVPERPRSLLVGTLSATGVLLLAGAVLFCVALVAGFGEVVAATRELSPGIVGGTLLILGQLLYLPNAIVFGTSYAVGPGFAFGAGTMVAPTGVAVGAVPLFPMLGALPDNGPAPVYSLPALVAPFLAGILGGVLTQRSAPTASSEAAPMWGLACGVTTGLVCGALAALAGGPLGAERLAEVGPSPWQVGLITALEVGVAAAIAAWLANWRYYRRIRAAEVTDMETEGRRAAERGRRGAPRPHRTPVRPFRGAPAERRP